MRVLQIISSLSTGGAETMLRNVLSQWNSREIQTMVISLTTRDPVGPQIERLGIPVLALESRHGVLTPRQALRLASAAASWRPDLVHAWMYHANVVAYGLAALLRRRSPAIVTSVRGALNAPDKQKPMLRLVRRLDARLSGRADAVVFNSAVSARQHVEVGYRARHISIIPNGFDVSRFAPSAVARREIRRLLGCDDEPLVGLIGRFNVLKGQRVFLEAAKIVVSRHERCRFLLVGRGCDPANALLSGWVMELGLEGRVLLLGERSDMPAIDCSLDVVVSASLSESFPNAIGEAMACGVPAVVTDVGDCSELIGDSGRVVPARDARALAEAIGDLLGIEPPRRAELGRRARSRIVDRYALEAVASRYGALYEDCLARRAVVR
jgi:glycosyltransferase involved in cell wall biosynthesis